jgi:archaellum component FlaC
MFENDLLLAFLFMALLFVRQIFILKQPNKINYGPLMIGIGMIGSIVHFIIHPDASDLLLLIRESLFPLLVALLLYIVMNIMHQTQQSENARSKDMFTQTLIEQMGGLKKFVSDLEARMVLYSQDERLAQEEIREKFKNDIKALDAIQKNQADFLDKFNEMELWHKDVSKEFAHFTSVQMPALDDVVHKHIDILRIAEQDHYNQLKKVLQTAVDSRGDMVEDIEDLKKNLLSMKSLSDDIARSITRHTLQQLSDVTNAFEGQIVTLKSHAESVKTSLYEGDSTLEGIRNQSEIIMKQMVLSSNKMKELKEQNDGLYDLYNIMKELIADVEAIKSDYVKSQAQLGMIADEFKTTESDQLKAMNGQIEALGEILSKKIDKSLEDLHKHYHIAGDDITHSVQILAKKAQLKNGYTDLDS